MLLSKFLIIRQIGIRVDDYFPLYIVSDKRIGRLLSSLDKGEVQLQTTVSSWESSLVGPLSPGTKIAIPTSVITIIVVVRPRSVSPGGRKWS